MGKSLVINGIDATPANLGQVELIIGGLDITGTLQTKGSTSNGYGAQYLHYPNDSLNNAYQPLNGNPNTKIGYIDVSRYVGQTLVATIGAGYKASQFSGGAWWRCFASAMSSASIANNVIQNAVTAVQHVEGVGGGGTHTFYLPIPTGAVYFIFNYQQVYESEYRFIII
jgi:hypothetical protein